MRTEQRKLYRYVTSAHLELTGQSGTLLSFLTDVSSAGIGCRAKGMGEDWLKPGQEVRCSFILPTGKVCCTSRVSWVCKDSNSAGLAVLALDPDSQRSLESYCDSPF